MVWPLIAAGAAGMLLGGKSGSSKQTSTTQLDPVQRAAIQENMAWARRAAEQPFQQYGGNWSAGPSSDQTSALARFRNSQNVGSHELGLATTGARQGMGYQGQQVGAQQVGARSGSEFMGQYFNPFLKQVVGGMTDEAFRGRNMQIIADEDKALAAGAYGGSRHGVMDAETTRGFHDVLQRNTGDLYARGFDTAAGLGMQDAGRFTDVAVGNADRTLRADQGNQQTDLGAANVRLGASGLLHNIGDTKHDNYLADAQGLFGAGSVMQQMDQQRIDREREKFNEWRDYPAKQASIINSAVSGMPNMGGTTTQSKQPGAAEMALTLAPFLMMSDKNVKGGIGFFDEDDALEGLTETPVKKWRYDPAKGGPNDGGRPHVGPMAQDMKKNLGIGDGRSLPVVDVMGAHHAAIKSLAKKVNKLQPKRKGK